MDQRWQNSKQRSAGVRLAVLCTLAASAVSCTTESGGEADPTPDAAGGVTVPTISPGEVDDSNDPVPPGTLAPPDLTAPTVSDGEVGDGGSPGTLNFEVEGWSDLLENGQLDVLQQQVAAADPVVLAGPIAVFEALIALSRRDSATPAEIADLERLAADVEQLDPELESVVTGAVDVVIARTEVAPEVAGG